MPANIGRGGASFQARCFWQVVRAANVAIGLSPPILKKIVKLLAMPEKPCCTALRHDLMISFSFATRPGSSCRTFKTLFSNSSPLTGLISIFALSASREIRRLHCVIECFAQKTDTLFRGIRRHDIRPDRLAMDLSYCFEEPLPIFRFDEISV
jgi:hypothetical protein